MCNRFQGSPASSAIQASAMLTSSSQALTLWTSPPWVCDQRPSHRLFPSLPVESNFSENSFPSFRLKEALEYAKSAELGEDAKDVWVFDIDETLLSNLPYYADHGFGLEVFDGVEFDKWVDKAMAPPIESSLKLYEEVLKLGFKVFLLTGRSEQQRGVTVANLINLGFQDWDKLILRATEDHGKLATIYKSEKRNEMVEEGYRILGNSGDQWSDLLGSSVSIHSFKLPNPMYYIP
ncbi:unnamed protein product [Camellia sinensis]